jgi:fumarylpyruvate hydrolase
MTRRDLQGEAKKMGRPWDTGKAFDQSAPCSALMQVSQCGHPANGAVRLFVNDELRQEGDLNQLIWNVPDTIAYLSTLFSLEAGDLIFSGTPAGVAAVKKGDVLKGHVAGLPDLIVKIV